MDLGDAFPVTNLQEGLMAITTRQPGSYIAKHVYKLSRHVDLARFKTAWEQTIQVCRNLRARILLIEGKAIQVVVADDISWDVTSSQDLDTYIRVMQSYEMSYGSRLCRYALIEEKEPGSNFFAFSVHHTVFDGWSLPLLISTLNVFYHEITALTL